MIVAEGVSKQFGSRRVVDDVSFEVCAGQVLGIVGPNGSGKTTTLRMLLGLARPSAGRALIDGRPLLDHAVPARVVGAAFVGPVGPPGRRARAQISLVAAAAGVGADEADRRLSDVGLSADAAGRLGDYSTGMERRMALAVGTLAAPRALVLDEPTAGLDPVAGAAVWDLIADAARGGCTICVASHALEDLLRVADQVIAMAAGRIEFRGSPAEFRDHGQAPGHALAALLTRSGS